MQLTTAQVHEIAYLADLDPEQDIHLSYSGRYMYGRTCLGVVGRLPTLLKFVRVMTSVVTEDDDMEPWDLDEVLDDVRSDSMGLDTIYYFPALTVEDEPATV